MSDNRVYSIEIATKIGRISRGQASSWAKNGTFVPSKLYWTETRPYSYLYTLADLLALRIVSILRTEHGVALSNALGAVADLRADASSEWSEMRLQIPGNRIADPSNTRAAEAWIEIGPIAEAVRIEADKLWHRSPDDYGKVERKRNVMHGTLVVKGTRIPVSTVVALVNAGWDIDRIRQGYPTLQPEDIQGVMRYAEEHKLVA